MSLLIDEIEPILSATETARTLPKASPSSKNEEKELLSELRLDRVAILCVAMLSSIDRSLYRLGVCVNRLVRICDRKRGLTALAAKITEACGKVVSRQFLGHALRVFENFTKEESENRFSNLTNTHLLKAAQGFPDPSDRDDRNAILDRAVKENSSVAELATIIKNHKAGKATKQSPDPPPPADDASVVEARGYVCGDELTELAALSDRGVEFLRVRETVPAVDTISEAGRVLSAGGLMIVDLAGLDGYPDVCEAANKTDSLRVIHTLIVLTSSLHRNASHGLPVEDGFRVMVLVGGRGFRHSQSQPKHIDNPMSEADADELIYSIVPDSGLVVDIGTGSAQTAEWAEAHGREYLAAEPNETVHAKSLADLEASLSTHTCSDPTAPDPPDLWPMVSPSQREQASSEGKPWGEMICCARTVVAIVVTGATSMSCPACRQKCTAKPGGVTC